MSGYGEDRANSQVNETILEQEFGLDTTEERNVELETIREMRTQLQVAIDREDPDELLYKNIERANELLDIATREIANGGSTNARLFEVCGQLINSITSATVSISNNSFGAMKHEYNMRMLQVKQDEVDVKRIIAGEKAKASGGVGDGEKVVVMDRESLLKLMEEDTSREIHVESHVPEEE